MRLPFMQVSQEEMARARTLAGFLDVPYPHAIGMVVALKAAALEVAPEGDLSGGIIDPNPSEWIAVQCGWPMDRGEALVRALVRCGFAMSGPSGGLFVCGLDAYTKALETSLRRSEAGRKGAEARKAKGGYGRAMAGPQHENSHDMAGDAKTQTQTQTQTQRDTPSGSAASAPLAPEAEELPDATEAAEEVQEDRPPLVLRAQKPEKPARKPSAGEALFARLEESRQKCCEAAEVPFVPSRWPHARMNRDLGPVARLEADSSKEDEWWRFKGAWQAFIEDDEAERLDVPFSLDFFWRMRSRYEGRALKGES